MNEAFFWPLLAQVTLTAIVWMRMYRVRVTEMRQRRIHPQQLALSGAKADALRQTSVADNFVNLFEVPVLFFTIGAILVNSAIESPLLIALAWIFVALRALHSLIQTTYNKVMHRFPVYVASTVVVFAMWAVTAVELLR